MTYLPHLNQSATICGEFSKTVSIFRANKSETFSGLKAASTFCSQIELDHQETFFGAFLVAQPTVSKYN